MDGPARQQNDLIFVGRVGVEYRVLVVHLIIVLLLSDWRL